ncbi:hypothetical protein CXG81DRAFT_23258 [Caulochytrium protostelioides]|uniref:Peroxin/Ferlin domain-containing protein n=1 Tax=Caulochytrium protostelioides TaxID=1555241 RepID=A0A4P9XF16_9FUNG|nr:hypothetical protein CXG81DRAFT_23258 [Caulochytrium protostelioides]|eukprot:RKP04152.1 hypothetical protein CXG81DRAFT_23258 [Caulochytrium protostelioides]
MEHSDGAAGRSVSPAPPSASTLSPPSAATTAAAVQARLAARRHAVSPARPPERAPWPALLAAAVLWLAVCLAPRLVWRWLPLVVMLGYTLDRCWIYRWRRRWAGRPPPRHNDPLRTALRATRYALRHRLYHVEPRRAAIGTAAAVPVWWIATIPRLVHYWPMAFLVAGWAFLWRARRPRHRPAMTVTPAVAIPTSSPTPVLAAEATHASPATPDAHDPPPPSPPSSPSPPSPSPPSSSPPSSPLPSSTAPSPLPAQLEPTAAAANAAADALATEAPRQAPSPPVAPAASMPTPPSTPASAPATPAAVSTAPSTAPTPPPPPVPVERKPLPAVAALTPRPSRAVLDHTRPLSVAASPATAAALSAAAETARAPTAPPAAASAKPASPPAAELRRRPVTLVPGRRDASASVAFAGPPAQWPPVARTPSPSPARGLMNAPAAAPASRARSPSPSPARSPSRGPPPAPRGDETSEDERPLAHRLAQLPRGRLAIGPHVGLAGAAAPMPIPAPTAAVVAATAAAAAASRQLQLQLQPPMASSPAIARTPSHSRLVPPANAAPGGAAATPSPPASPISAPSIPPPHFSTQPLELLITLETHENQRSSPKGVWSEAVLATDGRMGWTDRSGRTALPKDSVALPTWTAADVRRPWPIPLDPAGRYLWMWEGGWKIDRTAPTCDARGWRYGTVAWDDWKAKPSKQRCVRTRRWVRLARLHQTREGPVAAAIQAAAASQAPAAASTTSTTATTTTMTPIPAAPPKPVKS